jgi:Protein phosphatase 2C
VRLVGAVTQGSGLTNEDGFGFVGREDAVSAAWVFDGVTGINEKAFLTVSTDAQWIVGRADGHLRVLALQDIPLQQILIELVDRLVADLGEAIADTPLPQHYDPPATCLILAKRYPSGWQVMRLGDSALMAQRDGKAVHVVASAFDDWYAQEVGWRRNAGALDSAALMAKLRPEQFARRQMRNRNGGYSILEASPAAKLHAEFFDFGWPDKLLLCTDGFYRAVDHYQSFTPDTLLATASAPGGITSILDQIRVTERADLSCQRYPRLKPSDDATALCLLA